MVKELLRAEQAGRRLAISCTRPVSVIANTSLAGAAALAAARHLANAHLLKKIYLADLGAHTMDTFSTMLEVAGSMDLPLVQGNPSPPFIDGTESGMAGATLRAGELLLSGEIIDWELEQSSNMFLKEAQKQEALSAAAVREIDKNAIEEFGLPGVCLMENAGIGATATLLKMRKSMAITGPVIILVGYGNNGGDGLVVARELSRLGISVTAFLLGDPLKLRGDAKVNLDIACEDDGLVQSLPDNLDVSNAGLIVDALFGTGLARSVDGRSAEIIKIINNANAPVLALDLPSGMNADTGEVMGVAVKADATVTFAAPKTGMFVGDGPELCGEITVAGIGVNRSR